MHAIHSVHCARNRQLEYDSTILAAIVSQIWMQYSHCFCSHPMQI